MDIQNMKNIVILKNIPSNMIEEAFVVLKDNVKVHKEELIGNKNKKSEQNIKLNNKDYVIKEAEMIVSEYMNNIVKKQFKNPKERIKLEEKCKRLKYLNIFLAVFSLISIISIILR